MKKIIVFIVVILITHADGKCAQTSDSIILKSAKAG
jgi:hypothetical protein